MKREVIDKYIKDLSGLLEEVKKIPIEEIKTDKGETPPYENMVIFMFGYFFKFFKFKGLPVFSKEYPDAWMFNEEPLSIEFEACSSDFESHGHDKKECNLIICWKHDWDKCPENIDVLALEDLWKLAKESSQ
jgi:hypothetical protein